MLRILHTVEFYHPHIGGAEIVVQRLSEGMVRKGHQVTVATTKLPERRSLELNGVQIKEFDVQGSLATGFKGDDISQYISFVSGAPYDVMLNYAAQQWATDLAFPSLAEPLERINIIVPCGYSALTNDLLLRGPEYAVYFNKLLPPVLQRYDAAVYHSAAYKDFKFALYHKLKNSVIIPNGIDESEFSSPPAINFREKYGISGGHLLLCVANFLEDKGHERVVRAFRRLKRNDCTLVMIGSKNTPILERIRQECEGLNTRILVDIPRQDTVAALLSSDLFVFASHIEVFPLVIVEAMAAGLPFVSTDCGNVREMKGGVVCEPEQMHLNIQSLLDDEPARRDLGAKGRQECLSRYTWGKVVDQYEALYFSLLDYRKRGHAAMR